MKKVVSFSGGRTSAYLCHLMIERYGRENVDFVFMDTGAEHAKTYEFIRKVNKSLNLNLTCLRGDFSSPLGGGVHYSVVDIGSIKPDLIPFKEMMAKYGVPYIGGMLCTDRMKLKPFKKYCDDTYGKGNYETWLGIRADEPVRYLGEEVVKMLGGDFDSEGFRGILTSMVLNGGDVRGKYDLFDGMWPEHADPNTDNEWLRAVNAIDSGYAKKSKGNIHYLAEISDFEKQDVLNHWSSQPFDLEIEEWSGNCEFCPKKSDLKVAASQRDSPESYVEWLDALHSDSVRIDDKTGHWSKMYRGKQSLESLIATFDGSTGDEIKARMRGAKHLDTGSCSESCEVFQ